MRNPIRPRHDVIARRARKAGGQWVLAAVYPSSASVQSTLYRVGRGEIAAYNPVRTFEMYSARHEDGAALWVRCVSRLPKPAPRPASMTYRVCDRGSGRGYVGIRIVTVVVGAECPRCGGPRAEGRSHRFPEDGEWYSVDKWDNACGHVDMYEAVLTEARALIDDIDDAVHRFPPACEAAAEFAGAVAVCAAAAGRPPYRSARDAARWLDVMAHREAARLLVEESAARTVRMTALDAAEFLRGVGKARTECVDCEDGRINYRGRDGEFASLACRKCRREVAARA